MSNHLAQNLGSFPRRLRHRESTRAHGKGICRTTPQIIRRDRSGFTLIELILAMLIASMLSLTLYTALNTAIKARRTAQRAALSTRSGSIAMDLISRDLECAVPPPASATDTTTTTAAPLTLAGPFQGSHQAGGGGDNDDLIFSTLSRDEHDVAGPLGDGICTVEFFVQSDSGTQVLVRRINRNPLAPTQELGVPEILCRNVKSFSLQYYDGTTWQPSWDSTQLGDVLPPAVMVTIEVVDPTPPSPQQAGPNLVQRLTRVIPLACAKPPPTE